MIDPPPRIHHRPLAIPYGGSNWARFFAGPKTILIRGRRMMSQENAFCAGNMPGEDAGSAEDLTVFAIAAGPSVATGDFITSELPAIAAVSPEFPNAMLAGAALTQPQSEVLRRLGLDERYLALNAARRFARVLTRGNPPRHAAPADADFLALTARLRDPAAVTVPAAIAFLPQAQQAPKLILRNRASLAAWLRARRITQLAPDTASFETTAAACAQADFVLIAEPSQAGLLGLCPPGTQVLEIAPEGFATGHIRAICDALGLRWQIFLATAPSYPLSQALPFGTATLLSYEIPIAALSQTLAIL